MISNYNSLGLLLLDKRLQKRKWKIGDYFRRVLGSDSLKENDELKLKNCV